MYPVDHVAASILEAVGDTPIVDLARLTRGLSGRLLAKCEYLNPAGSKKDLIACYIIDDALEKGLLQPGQTVVEITSGNTGNGLAMVCAIKGHPFIAVMSKGNSPERVKISRAMGAEVVLVDQAPGSQPGKVSGADLHCVEEAAQQIVSERRAFLADQFNRESNFRAHYLYTGPDIWRKTGGKIDAFCDLVGTGGSFAGCAAALKEKNPAIRCYVVEPRGMEVLAGCLVTCSRHTLQGAGYARTKLKLIHREHIDGFLAVDDQEATDMTRRLAREEGIFGGYTAGANVAAGLRLLHGDFAGRTVVVSIPDSGMKYFSTGLWD